MDEKQAQRQEEKHKALGEYLRFITTLSTGSIVLLISFIERLKAQPSDWLILAFIGFTACIVTSVIAYSFITVNFGRIISDKGATLPSGAILITWLSFIVAIISLMIFGLANL